MATGVLSIIDTAHLPKRLRTSLKRDFRDSVPRKLDEVWYHLKGFLELYNLRYSDSSFIGQF